MQNLINRYLQTIPFVDEIRIQDFVPEGKLIKKIDDVEFFKSHAVAPYNTPKNLETYYNQMKRSACKDVVTSNKIYYINASIEYPLSVVATIQFKCNTEITYGMLLYLYTIAYNLIYQIEDIDVGTTTGNISGMLNRRTSAGRYGIWGHHIDDLVYNGKYTISIHDNAIICQFNCDS